MSWPKWSLGVIGIAVIAILNGWHLVPVQTFAWATMAIGDASQGRTFTETLTAAIDGESKCQICHYVVSKTVVQAILACWIRCLNYLSSPLIGPILRFPRRASGPRLSTSQIASGFGQTLSRHRRLSARGRARLPWQASLGSGCAPNDFRRQ